MCLTERIEAVRPPVVGLSAAYREVSEGSDAEISAGVMSLARDANLLAAALTAFVGEWDSRCLYALDRSRSAAARLVRDTGCSPATAATLVVRARKLRAMPIATEAFAIGDLSADKVDLLCRANTPEREALVRRDEAFLVSQAKTLHFQDLKCFVAYWCSAADDAAAEDRASRDFAGRYLNLSETTNGQIDVKGLLDPVRGSVVANELQRIEQLLFEEDWAAAKAVWGDDMKLERLPRNRGQRRADALVIMATRSSAAAPGSAPAAPLFTVHLGTDAFAKMCELANGTVVTPGQVTPWLADAEVERIVFGPKSRVLDLGRKQRLFRGAVRRAIEIRDRHCTADGCRVPAHLCQVDHIIEWCAGGETVVENGRLRCGVHNRQRPGRTDRPPDPES